MKGISLSEALNRRRSIRYYASLQVDKETIVDLLETATKPTSIDGRRSVPSAHALYPISFMVTAGNVNGLEPGVYKFEEANSQFVKSIENDVRSELREAAIDDQSWVESAPVTVTICGNAGKASAHFADQFPYGARGERYMYLEAGAVAQTILLATVEMGLGSVLVGGFSDEATASIIGLEAPISAICHICIGRLPQLSVPIDS